MVGAAALVQPVPNSHARDLRRLQVGVYKRGHEKAKHHSDRTVLLNSWDVVNPDRRLSGLRVGQVRSYEPLQPGAKDTARWLLSDVVRLCYHRRANARGAHNGGGGGHDRIRYPAQTYSVASALIWAIG